MAVSSKGRMVTASTASVHLSSSLTGCLHQQQPYQHGHASILSASSSASASQLMFRSDQSTLSAVSFQQTPFESVVSAAPTRMTSNARGGTDWRLAKGCDGHWREGSGWADEEMFVIDAALQQLGSRLQRPRSVSWMEEGRGARREAGIGSVDDNSSLGNDDVDIGDNDDDRRDDRETAAAPDVPVLLLQVVAFQMGMGDGWREFNREKDPLRRTAREYLKAKPEHIIETMEAPPAPKNSDSSSDSSGKPASQPSLAAAAAAAASASSSSSSRAGGKKKVQLRWPGEERLTAAMEDCRFSARRDRFGRVIDPLASRSKDEANGGGGGGDGSNSSNNHYQDEPKQNDNKDEAGAMATGRSPDVRTVVAALSAIRSIVGGSAHMKADALAVGWLPCLLALLRHFAFHREPAKRLLGGDKSVDDPFRFGGRVFFFERRVSASVCCIVIDSLAAIVTAGREDGGGGGGGGGGADDDISYFAAAQLVGSGAMVRVVEAATVHSDDPRALLAVLQLWIAAMRVLSQGPPRLSNKRGSGSDAREHAWHLKHLSFPALLKVATGVLRRATEAEGKKCAEEPLGPLLWLAAHGLAFLLTGEWVREGFCEFGCLYF